MFSLPHSISIKNIKWINYNHSDAHSRPWIKTNSWKLINNIRLCVLNWRETTQLIRLKYNRIARLILLFQCIRNTVSGRVEDTKSIMYAVHIFIKPNEILQEKKMNQFQKLLFLKDTENNMIMTKFCYSAKLIFYCY